MCGSGLLVFSDVPHPFIALYVRGPIFQNKLQFDFIRVRKVSNFTTEVNPSNTAAAYVRNTSRWSPFKV